MSPFWNIIIIITFFSYLSCMTSQPYDYPTANLSSSWINSRVFASHRSADYFGNLTVRAILLRGTSGPRYACGFFCNGTCQTYLFAVFIVETNSSGGITSRNIGFPQVVWSANRNSGVKLNATLQLTSQGDLVLRDADGTLAWSTNTAGKSVAGLNLTELGNLVLFDARNSVVWQSFDHPTDVLVPGQALLSGQNLTASSSPTNWTEGGLFSVSMTSQGILASINSDPDPPQLYYENLLYTPKQNQELSYAKFQNGSLQLYINDVEPRGPDMSIPVPQATSAQFMKLGSDGHLRVFEWGGTRWGEVADIFTRFRLGLCNYPMVCGTYGVCSNGHCSCPRSESGQVYYRPRDNNRPDLGCVQVNAVDCDHAPNLNNHGFLDLEDVAYFEFVANIRDTNLNTCKEACLRNCSCRAAIFRYRQNSFGGDCYLPNRIFSLMNNRRELTTYNYSTSLKVQISPAKVQVAPASNRPSLGPILGSTLGAFCVAVALAITVFMYTRKRKREDAEEDYLDHVPGMLTRFSFQELEIATNSFDKKLGQGGFGSVFEGSLTDGTRIAVKCLDGVGQIKKSFVAEVESIGSIHHVNLVRLIGFCADKSHRLLVYDYMCNGSLDRWIYSKNDRDRLLQWSTKRKIILDIAKGLAYLHEDCRQKIIHLDIKPQNILLDEHHNAKLADFGLSKLIDRDQSQVVTTMRGTPGYIAPEWISAVITEKVDVYSFGVVVVEILSGRKVFEQWRPEEERHLLSVFRKLAEEGKWLDLVEDMQSNDVAQVVETMQIAAWCLQGDYAKRPAMSMVIKALEGGATDHVHKDIDFNLVPPQYNVIHKSTGSQDHVTPLLPSLLSGPR